MWLFSIKVLPYATWFLLVKRSFDLGNGVCVKRDGVNDAVGPGAHVTPKRG